MNKELSQSDYEEESNYSESSQEELIEEYRDIDDFENYEVSNLGQIRNKQTGRILKQRDRNNGYLSINLRQNKIKKTYLIHRLVAQAFLENPNNYNEIDHINHDKYNNNVYNLRWISKSENSRNRTSYNNKSVKYFDKLPFEEDCIEFQFFNKYFFSNYYINIQTLEMYYDTGYQFRQLNQGQMSGQMYYCLRDINNKRCNVSIKLLKREQYN
ncbi:Conserved_hypothetical protein [Hexamita inflata]|uniref:HNH nuclease domain-containing protein n=1 Tax=Hexamita inflata TaxID=28002 RepID=A0AA86RGW2_9EUKA|nr:Conserved hypothetical protein [Hexamita inflata]CAI9974513.1 Conserved hypothetical protein [Hexamita inflata]